MGERLVSHSNVRGGSSPMCRGPTLVGPLCGTFGGAHAPLISADVRFVRPGGRRIGVPASNRGDTRTPMRTNCGRGCQDWAEQMPAETNIVRNGTRIEADQRSRSTLF